MDEVYHILPFVRRSARFHAVMHSTTAVTIVADSDKPQLFRDYVQNNNIIIEQRCQATAIIVSPNDITYTPGVISYITSILSNEGINIVHFELSYEDTLLAVTEKDAHRTINIL